MGSIPITRYIADATQQRAIIYDRNQIKRIIEQYNELN